PRGHGGRRQRSGAGRAGARAAGPCGCAGTPCRARAAPPGCPTPRRGRRAARCRACGRRERAKGQPLNLRSRRLLFRRALSAVTPSSWQGVTTVVVGNCGFGIAPTRPEHRATIMRTLENVEGMPLAALEEGIRWEFESFPEYLDVLEHTPTRVNVAVLAGHTA